MPWENVKLLPERRPLKDGRVFELCWAYHVSRAQLELREKSVPL